jgi:small subunit ribosomal protein S6
LRNYEFVYIISPEVEEEDLQGVTERVGRMIADGGGEVLRLDSWGRRRLAYPIRRFREGHYMVAQIQLEGGAISELRARLALTEEVIRYLLVRAEEVPPVEARPHEEPPPDQEEVKPEEQPVEELGDVEPGEEPLPEEEAEDSEQGELGG